MEQRNWDDQLRSKLEDYEFTDFDKEDSWKRLDARLDKKSKKRKSFYWVAASIGLIFFISIGIYFFNANKKIAPSITQVEPGISVPPKSETTMSTMTQNSAEQKLTKLELKKLEIQAQSIGKNALKQINPSHLDTQLFKVDIPNISVLPAKLKDDSMKIFAAQMDLFVKMNEKRKAKLKIINASSLDGSIEELPLTPTKYKSIQFSVGSNLQMDNEGTSHSKPLNLTLFKN